MRSKRLTDDVRARLASARSVAFLTGAGISAESGLATFRGPDGLWEGRDPMTLATPEAFDADPVGVWRFYDWRRRQAAAARPNAAHDAIAALERARPGDVAVVTQNVDGLHERAGSSRVVRLHGSIWTLRCTLEGTERVDRTPGFETLPPRCACGAVLRPGVVWFGEMLPADALDDAASIVRAADVVVVVGTSSLVYPAAGLPTVALEAGVSVVEVNPEPTPLTPAVGLSLDGTAVEHVPALIRATAGATGGSRS